MKRLCISLACLVALTSSDNVSALPTPAKPWVLVGVSRGQDNKKEVGQLVQTLADHSIKCQLAGNFGITYYYTAESDAKRAKRLAARVATGLGVEFAPEPLPKLPPLPGPLTSRLLAGHWRLGPNAKGVRLFGNEEKR